MADVPILDLTWLMSLF